MNTEFEIYKPRRIDFIQNVTTGNNHIKVYTITNKEAYASPETLKSCIKALPDWTLDIDNSSLPTHRHAFLIVHEAREGVLILLNWWTGGEMLETKIYFADYSTPTKLEPSIFDTKSLVCIWELEIFIHERKAWISHVLSKAESPDFKNYMKDHLVHSLIPTL